MQSAVVVVGMGEIGAVFARGFLKRGMPVYPVVRGADPSACMQQWPSPEAVIVATGEADLQNALRALPEAWRSRTVLLQNELLPRDWEPHALKEPTIVSIWFEKKKGQDVKVLLSSPVWGPWADGVVKALGAVGIPAHRVMGARDMLFELVRKNVYILTTNIAGLQCGGNVTQMWSEHRALAEAVARDVMAVQTYLTGVEFDASRLLSGLEEGILGDPLHMCMGRSAPARLARMIAQADEGEVAVPAVRAIYQKYLLNS